MSILFIHHASFKNKGINLKKKKKKKNSFVTNFQNFKPYSKLLRFEDA